MQLCSSPHVPLLKLAVLGVVLEQLRACSKTATSRSGGTATSKGGNTVTLQADHRGHMQTCSKAFRQGDCLALQACLRGSAHGRTQPY